MNAYWYNLDENKFKFENLKQKAKREDVIAKGKEFALKVITNQIVGINQKIDLLKHKYPQAKIDLHLNLNKDYIYDEVEMKELEDIDRLCSDRDIKFNIELTKFAGGEYQNVLIARNQIEELKQKIENFTYEENGKQVNLSTYEKFLIVYKFVANRVYNEDEDFDNNDMRNWVGVLTSDKVICSGFASLLKCVCDRIFNAEELKCYEQNSDIYSLDAKYLESHVNNLIIINDPKYNLNGLYYADACWDSKSKKKGNKTTFNFCLIPIQQIVDYKKCNFAFDEDLFIYKNINPYYKIKSGCCDMYDNSLSNDLLIKFVFNLDKQLSNKEFEQQVDECLRVGNDYIYSQSIDDKKFARGLFAMARYVGLDEDKIMNWVRNAVEKREEFKLRNFGEKEIVLPKEKREYIAVFEF